MFGRFFFGAPLQRLARVFLGVAGVAFAVFFGVRAWAQVAGDGEAPKVMGITITGTTATTTTVAWETDEEADSLVNYGLDKNYGFARDPLPNKKKHKLILTDLEPSTVYHLRVVSADVWGNQSLSGDYIVVTKGAKTTSETEKLPEIERSHVEKAIREIEQVETREGLVAIANAIQSRADNVLDHPIIVGSRPHIEGVGVDYCELSWETDQETSSMVRFAAESEYRPDVDEPYTTTQGNPDERVTEHRLRMEVSRPGTLYHFSVYSENDLGQRIESKDYTCRTKDALPTVIGFRIIKVEEDAATLTWKTSIPAAGVVEYTDQKTKETKSAGSPDVTVSHTVRIAGLRLGSRYQAIVKAENSVGEKSLSNPIFFTTVKDQAPPLISKVSNESTLYPSAEAKVQTIVSWATDEPSFCQFFYRQGLAPNIEPSGLGEEKEPRTNHVQVVVEFLPSTVYQFWVECKDRAKNKTQSENFVLFTPNKEKSIIDIILENFEGTFGWVKNIGK